MIGHAWRRVCVDLRTQRPGAPVFEVFEGHPDMTGQAWRFRERVGGQTGSTSGEAYASRYNAIRAAYAHAYRTDGAKVRVLDPVS